MKYSSVIGVIAAMLLIGSCFLPWVYIEVIKTTITGVKSEPTTFGRPGLLHIVFSVISIILFVIPTIWAKRTNLFFGAFNFAWSIRNFLIITQCELGECPEKQVGIYAILILSALMLAMTFVPDIKLKE